MKILNSKEFINESYFKVTEVVDKIISLDNISLKCLWDGEYWFDYNREKRGTFEDFKNLENNKNTNFEVYLNLDFKKLDNENQFENDICISEVCVKLHYYDMSIDDYNLDFVYCNNIEPLAKYVSTCDTIENDFLKDMIAESWNECKIDEQLGIELEDRIGKIDLNKTIEEIKNCVIDGVIESYCDFI